MLSENALKSAPGTYSLASAARERSLMNGTVPAANFSPEAIGGSEDGGGAADVGEGAGAGGGKGVAWLLAVGDGLDAGFNSALNSSSINSIVIQPDGKILFGGSTSDQQKVMHLWRLNSGGVHRRRDVLHFLLADVGELH